jgi:hypothetical protein
MRAENTGFSIEQKHIFIGINLHLTSPCSLTLSYYSEINLEILRKIANNFVHHTPFSGQDLSPRISEEEKEF